MDTRKNERLIAAGIDTASALERMMGNEMLLERFLKRFLDDPNFETLKRAIAENDQDAALTASHTLKGLCGNLSMTVLFALFTRQVAAFRAGDWAGAAAMMEDISAAYDQVTAAVREVFAQ
jgi:HPt (histidine-containing phosphotransfer) domain-containing protein